MSTTTVAPFRGAGQVPPSAASNNLVTPADPPRLRTIVLSRSTIAVRHVVLAQRDKKSPHIGRASSRKPATTKTVVVAAVVAAKTKTPRRPKRQPRNELHAAHFISQPHKGWLLLFCGDPPNQNVASYNLLWGG